MSHVHRGLGLASLAGVMALTAGAARADGWYYEWACSETCAPRYPVGSGTEGPFESQQECWYAHDHDELHPERTVCHYVGQPPPVDNSGANSGGSSAAPPPASPSPSPSYVGSTSTPTRPVRLAKIALALAAGPSWGVNDGNGWSRSSAPSGAVEFEFHLGRDAVGSLLSFGFAGSRLSSPALGEGTHFYGVIPLMVGARGSPHLTRRVGMNLAATIGTYVQTSCTGCAEGALSDRFGFAWSLRGGLAYDFSKDRRSAVGLDIVYQRLSIRDDSSGLEVESPSWMLRLSLTGMIGEMM